MSKRMKKRHAKKRIKAYLLARDMLDAFHEVQIRKVTKDGAGMFRAAVTLPKYRRL